MQAYLALSTAKIAYQQAVPEPGSSAIRFGSSTRPLLFQALGAGGGTHPSARTARRNADPYCAALADFFPNTGLIRGSISFTVRGITELSCNPGIHKPSIWQRLLIWSRGWPRCRRLRDYCGVHVRRRCPWNRESDPTNIVMVYLLGATAAGLWLGRGPSALCAISGTAAFDYFFIPPRFSFYVAEPQYLLTLAGMLVVALVISNLMVSIRRQTVAAAARERRTAALYALCRDLAAAPDATSIASLAAPHVAAAIEGAALIVLGADVIEVPPGWEFADAEHIRWVFEHGVSAGPGTERVLDSVCQYLPLSGGEHTNAVLAVRSATTQVSGPTPETCWKRCPGRLRWRWNGSGSTM